MDAVHGALLMIRKTIQDQSLTETGGKKEKTQGDDQALGDLNPVVVFWVPLLSGCQINGVRLVFPRQQQRCPVDDNLVIWRVTKICAIGNFGRNGMADGRRSPAGLIACPSVSNRAKA